MNYGFKNLGLLCKSGMKPKTYSTEDVKKRDTATGPYLYSVVGLDRCCGETGSLGSVFDTSVVTTLAFAAVADKRLSSSPSSKRDIELSADVL